jgi:diacylglycerol kinase family enzyme
LLQENGSLVWSGADRVLISVNPIAGAGSPHARVDVLVRLLQQEGFASEVFTDLGEAAGQANQWHAEGRLRALVGVGGDGTAAELVNRTVPGVPITLLPAGNENLLARYLGLGTSPEAICQTVRQGRPLTLDAGKAADRVFLLMIGCGFDAEVVRRLHLGRQGHIRSRDYFKPIWQAIRTYTYPELRVDWELEEPPAGRPASPRLCACWLFVFNLPCYGGGFRIAPQAHGRDGLLDVCTLRRGSFWHALRYAGAVRLGRHQGMADCTTCRVRRLRITAEAEVPYQLDGDPGGFLPVDVEVLPGRLTLIVPAARAKELQPNTVPGSPDS